MIVTVIIHTDGRLHLASDKITEADARRWHEQGYEVFCIARSSVGRHFEVRHVGREPHVDVGVVEVGRAVVAVTEVGKREPRIIEVQPEEREHGSGEESSS